MIPTSNLVGRPSLAGINPLLMTMSNADIEARKQEKIAAQERAQTEMVMFVSSLASHIRRTWSDAFQAKQEIHQEMLRCLRQRQGQYDPDMLAAIRQTGGSEVFLALTDVKCRAAEAWINDILNGDERVWTLDPTIAPELAPEQEFAMTQQAQQLIFQQQVPPEEAAQLLEMAREIIRDELKAKAKDAADKMTQKIQDQFQEAGFDLILKAFVADVCTFPGGILKGPILRKRAVLKWGKDFQPVVEEQIVMEVQRISPFDAYPSANATTIDDGDLHIKHKLTHSELYNMIGMRGSKDTEIRQLLQVSNGAGYTGWTDYNDTERDRLEGKMNVWAKGGYYEAIEFRGSAPGRALIEWGMDKARIDDPDRSYQVEAWLIGPYVIRCVLNGDPLGRKPFSKACFVEIPGSFWGRSPPMLMRDVQGICNAAVRSLVDNMGMASGPQVGVDPQALPDGERLTTIFPWKIWQIKQGNNGNGQLPLHFFQPEMHAEKLINILDRFSRQADEVTNIPAYAYGSDVAAGAGRTASGLSMLMSSTSKSIRAVISNIDAAVRGVVERFFTYNMLYDPDTSTKGDAKVVSVGAMALLQKETIQMRRQEMLQATNNPVDLQIIGLEGRAKMLHEAFKTLEYSEEIIPTGDQLKEYLKQVIHPITPQAQSQQQLAMMGAGEGGEGADSATALDPAGAPQGQPVGDVM